MFCEVTVRMSDLCTKIHDPARLAALQQSRLLDTPTEPTFDRLTRLAAYALHASAAILSLVDFDRVFFKSSVGLPEPLATQREVPLSRSFCQLVAAAGEPIRIADARVRSFLQDDWAVRELGIVAYAGVPVTTPDGYVLGALCVIDRAVRIWTDEEVGLLWDLAAAAQSEIQLRQHIDKHQRLEAQLLQAQKIESVGRLASGVAHDFNNLLTAIIGYTDLALRDLPLGSAARSDLHEIQKVAGRAIDLTGQLMAFARKQAIELCPLNLNDLILDMDKLLRRLVAEDIELITLPDPQLGLINADPGRLGQVLVNLVINARDAMPNNGKLIIRTANITLNQGRTCQHSVVPAGSYVLLSVSDTGVGMSPEVLSRIFEPFFTTKDPSHGTGLGLATCSNIVKQHGGHIYIESVIGQGTTVSIYLPQADDTIALHPYDETYILPSGSETILLAEDDASVRTTTARCLRDLGYTVLETTNGDDAFGVAQAYDGMIDLLLTDVVMPCMGGPLLAERLATLRPGIRVLFMSGYADAITVHPGRISNNVALIQKPFLPAELARKVREVLDR
jgi:two-component system, cell cycle sensor histidine kinase and response regulator CckA